MRHILTFTLMFLAPLHVFAASCDCTHFPIKPSACLPPCRNAVLLKSSKGELNKEFKLDSETTRLVLKNRDNSPSSSLDGLKQSLPAGNYNLVLNGVSSISEKTTTELASKYNLNTIEGELNPARRPALSALPHTASNMPVLLLTAIFGFAVAGFVRLARLISTYYIQVK